MAASMSRKEPSTATSPPTSTTPTDPQKAKPKPKSKPSLTQKLTSTSTTTSRTTSPAPGETSFSSAPGSTSKPPSSTLNEDPNDPTRQRCKHCKQFVPKLGFSTHSKQCLRDKQEATRRKREAVAQAEAAANGTAVPEFISGKLKDGKMKAEAKDLTRDHVKDLKISTESANASAGVGSRQGTAGLGDNESVLSAALSMKEDDQPLQTIKKKEKKTNGKKRKADKAGLENDTESVAGSTTGAAATTSTSTNGNPPKKKQKKKDTPSENNPTTTTTSTGTSQNPPKDPSSTKKSTNPTSTPNTTNPSTTTGTTNPKQKGPVDVERQCGVALPNGGMCARSLTCKSHPMGAKRAVPGRSLPYDMLLAQWTKKNQAKQQKAALESNQPAFDSGDGANGTVDSDEETDKVMLGISRAAPRPLWERVPVSMAGRYGVVRVKEVLREAMGGSRGGGLFAVGSSVAVGGRAVQGSASAVQGVRQMETGPGAGGNADGVRKGSVGVGVAT